MRLQHYFLILTIVVVALCAVLMVVTFKTHPSLFYGTEVVLCLVLAFLVFFYRRIIRPIDSLTSGMELLRDQDMSTTLAPSGQKETDEIVQTFNALITRLRNEHLRMDEQNSFLNLLINASPMGVVQCDLSGNITTMNPAAERMLTPSLKETMLQLPLGNDTTVRLSNSQIYHLSHLSFLDRGYQHPFFLIESLTSEVMKAEKHAYEKVIRMIAHEVNNNVAGIVSTLDIIQTELSGDTAQEALEASRERTQKMAEFVTRFANVVKVPEPQLTLCDLSEEVETCHSFLEGLCQTHHIRLTLELTDEATPVHLDTTLFQQVLVNIVKNAIESIGDKGEIKIETHPKTLTITDNGRGISPEVAPHLFTPFYSTKPQGQGLGLLLIRDILTKHGCTFTLLTDPNDGLTRFTIVFP
ncbi:MAG: HAMP domain-containing protein [Bacteroidaceae bacterium]|nr:HAMP domain-containing protein [Bacteroidaceae bacterium]